MSADAEAFEIAEPSCDGDSCLDKVASLLAPHLPSAQLEHVGSTSVPGCLGKGDIDILARVPVDEFAASREVLDRLLPRSTANEPTDSYAEYRWAEAGTRASVHLVAIGGTHDDFHRFKALLLADPDLVQRYNALKLRYRGRSMDDYRAAKSELIDRALAAAAKEGESPRAAAAHLETERLLLRRLAPYDAPALHRCTGDPLVMRYWYPGPDADVSATSARIAGIEAHWRSHGFGDYAVVERASNELIGFAGLHHIAGMTDVNVGYVLVPDRWRRGLGSELCRSLLEHAFTVLELPQVVAVIDPANTASIALSRRCGFTLRRRFAWQGQPRALYVLTRAASGMGR